MAWYEKWFGEDYIDVYKHRNEQEAHSFINTLENKSLLRPGYKVLDLCCGGGRYTIAVALKGYEVAGIDLSADLIHYAEQKAREKDVPIDFHIGDMRAIPYENHFNVVINMFTSFGYFDLDAEDGAVVRGVSDALKKNGWFVLDFMNKDQVLNQFNPYDEQIFGTVTLKQKRHYDKSSKRIEKQITLVKNGISKEYIESVRLYSPRELEDLFRRYGLEPEYRFGNYEGSPFRVDTPRFILIGRKR